VLNPFDIEPMLEAKPS